MWGAGAVVCSAALIVTLISHVSRGATTSSNPTGQSVRHARETSPSTTSAFTKGKSTSSQTLTVMAIGGSSAQGYDAPKLDGYLTRAMQTVSSKLNLHINFVNKAVSGGIPTMLAPQYDPLLYQVKPNVVLIAWGLLNDIARKTPQAMFERVIKDEVSMAVAYGADVWIVTPPVTPATYVGHDVKLEQVYTNLEVAGAREVHSSHVHVFDLLSAMKSYLKVHHLSYKPYASNNWHMNLAGHILAGQILANEILTKSKAIGLVA
ncbi:hypothetical protein AYW79_01425 [Ferroacidibacillus organovorans]|uniref:SGNH/GDSL hydrolase family protein n=2 Tax=Ferroacidibacillus organovorans TaxID=1765683 RepID=A0A162U238_9BACL|nr:hypothetical protein AYJ22_00825 [Ferroacidibacillus organovorans]OAG95130.1 hypothetical protein AYW79_01425 [Ferroacidibacillus organovorans]OPG15118.1 SGNH/GDSL hydrolase family protein [Ferroacidibacillus organovorans]